TTTTWWWSTAGVIGSRDRQTGRSVSSCHPTPATHPTDAGSERVRQSRNEGPSGKRKGQPRRRRPRRRGPLDTSTMAAAAEAKIVSRRACAGLRRFRRVLLPPFLVLGPVPREPSHLSVALEHHQMRADAIEEPAVVR